MQANAKRFGEGIRDEGRDGGLTRWCDAARRGAKAAESEVVTNRKAKELAAFTVEIRKVIRLGSPRHAPTIQTHRENESLSG